MATSRREETIEKSWLDEQEQNIRPDRWACGDMFFVYPGKSGVPELSLRFKQLSYGNMDYFF